MRAMGETTEKGEDNIERILTLEKFYRLVICSNFKGVFYITIKTKILFLKCLNEKTYI